VSRLSTEVGLGPGHIVLGEEPAPISQKGGEPPIFGPFLLSPNGWMHQDATWYGGRPQPSRLCVRWGLNFLFPKGTQPPFFVHCPLWPNDWMDEDATWYGSRPRPKPRCIRLALRERGTAALHLFGPCLLWPRSPISATAELLLAIFCVLHFQRVARSTLQTCILNSH